MALCILLTSAFHLSKNRIGDKGNVQGVNFVLPHKNILLKRENINSRLDKIFHNKKETNIAMLLGVGVSGKTTVARAYARSKEPSIIWEINTETKGSILLGFENLAYLLCGNDVDKKELRYITGIKDQEKKKASY